MSRISDSNFRNSSELYDGNLAIKIVCSEETKRLSVSEVLRVLNSTDNFLLILIVSSKGKGKNTDQN